MKGFIRLILVLWITCYWFLGNANISNATVEDGNITINVWDTPSSILKDIYTAWKKDWTINSKFWDIARPTWYAQCWSSNKICMAVESIRAAISPYVNFAVFVILAIATILIIYNWFGLVIGKWDAKEITEAKTKITNIVTWIVIISWFVIIIRMLMSVVVMITW